MAKKKSILNSNIFSGAPFDADGQLKYTLASHFWGDSNDFLWRVSILKDKRPHDSNAYFAKIYVDLLMSAECALKSLIVSLSQDNETPEQAYMKARQYGHDLQKLYDEVKLRAKRRVKLLNSREVKILLKANTLKVNYRYGITTFLFLLQENTFDRAFRDGAVSSVVNYTFITAFYKVLHTLKDIAVKSNKKYYGKHMSMMGSDLERLEPRRERFFNNIKHKL